MSAAVLAGRTFRMMRHAHGLTQRQVAQEVGLSASHLSRVETGQVRASERASNALCHFYGTTTARRADA